ncbi:MAG: hypothetical protein KKA19_08965 [Candidatus Margulisbacteria bacterium]|nr:hypothetical protein [Candidatus Margulisiibacteriota bacterium]
MKKIFIAVFFSIFSLSICISAPTKNYDLTKPYTPTRAEWLQSQLLERQNIFNSMHNRSMSVTIYLNTSEKIIYCYYTLEKKAKNDQITKDKDLIKYFVKNVLDDNDWSKDMAIKFEENPK